MTAMNTNKPKLSTPTITSIPKLKFDNLSRNVGKNLDTNYHTARYLSVDCLSHTFRAAHVKVQEKKGDFSQHLFDLTKTLEINLQIIDQFLPSLHLQLAERKSIKEKLKAIKELYHKKALIKENKAKMRTKVLVDLQISEEAKRRKKEVSDCNDIKLREAKASIDKKTIFIKRFQKKFNEVELYIHTESKSSARYKNRFCDYEIFPFIYNNEKYLISKSSLCNTITMIKTDIRIILKENIELKKREELITEENQTESDQYEEMVQSYKSKIAFFQINNEHLRKEHRDLLNQIKLQRIQHNLFENGLLSEENDDKSLNLTNVKYGDDNVILTEQSETLNTKKTTNQFGWDISRIEKTEGD